MMWLLDSIRNQINVKMIAIKTIISMISKKSKANQDVEMNSENDGF